MIYSRDIKDIQEQLIALVGEPDVADGKWGGRTQRAVEKAGRRDYRLHLVKEASEDASLVRERSDTPILKGAARVLACAERYLGVHEIKGVRHNPKILKFWDRIKMGGINDDETYWCAAFVGACLEECGYRSTRSGRARSYEKWGVRCLWREHAPLGAIVILARGRPGSGSGHVGFLAKLYDGMMVSPEGTVHLLGGNQSDQVCYRDYSVDRLVDVRVFPTWISAV